MENPTKVAHDMPSADRYVYIVDDDRDIRTSLHFLLTSVSLTPRSFGSPQDFIDELPHLVPGPILLDIRMAELDGFQVLETLAERDFEWPVIMLTAHGNVSTAVRAIKLGAMEFIEKPFAADILTQALEQAFTALDQAAHRWLRRDNARLLFGRLSKRECQVIEMLMEGAGNKQMAHRLGISFRTVELHRSKALAKLGVKSVGEVVAIATAAEVEPGSLLLQYHDRRSKVID
ncbi:response regulator [Altererythrobacter sp. KTW20L]|uniref:response regulator transcription factor n=1 Tax=Altererythrobacter sp. KTW20L TaxID=2942210 RepID=UPI0020BFB88E|nr:response regulator [Altererythrobacter sp. KTW20L]MCL6252258.1 response regulator [Altererythrobacter sp. KTW20L]